MIKAAQESASEAVTENIVQSAEDATKAVEDIIKNSGRTPAKNKAVARRNLGTSFHTLSKGEFASESEKLGAQLNYALSYRDAQKKGFSKKELAKNSSIELGIDTANIDAEIIRIQGQLDKIATDTTTAIIDVKVNGEEKIPALQAYVDSLMESVHEIEGMYKYIGGLKIPTPEYAEWKKAQENGAF